MNLNVYQFVFCFSMLEAIHAYTCYKCSYSLQTEHNRTECLFDPDTFGFNGHLDCNETSYCSLQEQYDLHKKIVTSYFRTCSGTSWGNECHKDWSHVTCRASCQGNFCNKQSKGTLYKQYMEAHKDDPAFGRAATNYRDLSLMFLTGLSFVLVIR